MLAHPLRYVVCDVFTDRALTGNQLAVFTDARALDPATMQSLAREMNYSESTFVLPPQSGGHARIRIFTPRRELPFAGHPTLGSAWVIGSGVPHDELRLETGAGIIPIRLDRSGNGSVTFGWMTQPLPKVEPFADTELVLAALGVPSSGLPVLAYDNGVKHVYVELKNREAVAALSPDLSRIAHLPVGVNAFAGAGAEWKTRMFAPGHGVSEDPATGSAAGPLALHLATHGRIAFGDTIRIEQGAELDRPSILFARALGTPDHLERIEVGGTAVIVARGEFRNIG